MKIKHKKITTAITSLLLLFGVMVAPTLALATPTYAKLECSVLPSGICDKADDDNVTTTEGTAVWHLLKLVIQIMTAGVGILALGGILYAATLYMSAGGNQERLKKSKTMILNVVIGVVAFALMFALLQWLIPGGVF